MDPLQGHFSDSTAFLPRKPSRLGPGRSGLGGGVVREGERVGVRGTVSMPVSPVMGRARLGEGWGDMPHTAQAFFGVGGFDGLGSMEESGSIEGFSEMNENVDYKHEQPPLQWYNPQPPLPTISPTTLRPTHPAPPQPFQAHNSPYTIYPPESEDSYDPDHTGTRANTGGRKKRAQVRVACTHCQKACKKCSNTRPCERCVKYGLEDCVDSMRRPRKTGVKRGPYKRRLSKYHSHSPSPTPTNPLPDQHNHNPHTNPKPQHNSPPNPAPHFIPTHQPPQPPVNLSQKLSSALSSSRPQWLNGQRRHFPPPTYPNQPQIPHQNPINVLYPHTPIIPFPTSLHSGEVDPFSRAVSPIGKGGRGLGLGLGFDHSYLASSTDVEGEDLGGIDLSGDGPGRFGYTNTLSHHTEISPTEIPFPSHAPPHPYSFSARPSPKSDPLDSFPAFQAFTPQIQLHNQLDRQTPSHQTFTFPHHQQLHLDINANHARTQEILQSPAIIALRKIRKPSMRTLLDKGGSQAGSRATSPVGLDIALYDDINTGREVMLESPTLVGEMHLDDVEMSRNESSLRKGSLGGMAEWRRMSLGGEGGLEVFAGRWDRRESSERGRFDVQLGLDAGFGAGFGEREGFEGMMGL